MQSLIDKLLLLALCSLSLLGTQISALTVISLLTAVAVSALCSYWEGEKPAPWLAAAYVALCLWQPSFVTCLPLVAYDCAAQKWWPVRVCFILPVILHLITLSPLSSAAALLLSLAAWLLYYRTDANQKVQQKYRALEDNSKELAIRLERKNRELMEKQDYEVRLATLAERNRIAREIHDNVGHLLTRSLLQVSAMQVAFRKEAPVEEQLRSIKETLSGAMNAVRASVHGLHEESVDLRLQLEALLGGFRFCPVRLTYDAGVLPKELRYAILSIVRESLSNIAKHSDATQASVSLVEHPALYQLTVKDNGTRPPAMAAGGIGLQNMRDRVESFHGVFRAGWDHGYSIFISIPKERGPV